MQVLQIFNEFAWLMHMGILDGVKKKSNSRCLLNRDPGWVVQSRVIIS